ncbi:hypothetical protein HID58_057232 [Brassica napus]|uniref:BnaC03g67440D protein n=2 Tax=Brassica napus TaxID=3708 RepID=A0A078HSY2_BRANA|nr:hypothetical protein HID58_057232 [Brassica napus]CDY39873.1 BnaC03g67440D [Brassica napus]
MQISVSDPLSIIQSFLNSILMSAHLMLPYISTTTHQAIGFGITLPSDSQASSRFISLLLHVILTFTVLPNLREARRQLSIITTLVGKEYYDNSEQSYEGSYRRLKYVGYETESFLILTFLREVSNVLPIPWDPLIPYCIFVCDVCYNSTTGGSFDLQFPLCQPISSLRNTRPQKLLKLLKPVVE